MNVPIEKLNEQVAGLLAQGIPLGTVHGYEDRDYEVLYSLGHSLYSQARYSDAMKVFGFLVMHNHMERRFVKAFASALQMAKHYPEAMHFYTLATAMDLTDPTPSFHMCECLIATGKHAEARAGLEMVVRQSTEEKYAPLRQRAAALLAVVATVPQPGRPS